ncbi:MAG: hypothetical protein KGN84_19800 [Acidobacteriota bacterium]|nr:hypothetical protein [Acidobacteriota bacterium]
MCRRETGVRIRLIAALVVGALSLPAAQGQTWTPVGGLTVARGLAGPSSGPIQSVWYSASGNRLLVLTASNRIFETSDFEHWRLNSTDTAPSAPLAPAVVSLPETSARVVAGGPRTYARGRDNVFASEDAGRTWVNLTGYNNQSIIGGGFSALAVSPANPQELVAANQAGAWRSMDGGLSWRSLNEGLPNLPARKLIARRVVALADSSVIRLQPGGWIEGNGIDPEVAVRAAVERRSGRRFTALAQAGTLIYGGTGDGSLAVSRDGGTTWSDPQHAGNAPIERLWADRERPESALAASGTRLLRTVNGGLFWDDVTGALPEATIHGISADRAAGAVYVATDRGVFTGNLSLNDAGSAASGWTSISADLPAAAVWDVRLNSDNTVTVALDGYGIFEAPAPKRAGSVRIVNGADLSDRAAAPGSLISVLGANIRQGTANGTNYPVLAASDQNSQLQVPFETAPGVMQITLEGAAGRWTAPLTVKGASPAIFVDSEGSPLFLDPSSGLVIDAASGIHAGSSVQVMATGLGKVTPDWPTGVPAPVDAPPAVRGQVTAFIDGTPAPVTRATLAPGYVGYYLVEFQVPPIVNQGLSEFRIVMNGEESNRVTLYLKADVAAQ